MEDKSKEISLLNIKRNNPEHEKGKNDHILFKKEINLCKKKLNDLNLKNKCNILNILSFFNKKKISDNPSLIKPENKNSDNIFNLIELRNKSNKIDNCVNINFKDDQFNDNNINNNTNKIENNNDKKPFLKKHKNFNNEVRVKDNNKIVYINSYLMKPMIIKKHNKNGGKKRSSKYRGVSKNGNKWQAIMHSKDNKSYISTYSSEEDAARIYDIMSIKARGIKAKTNFEYTNSQIKKIMETEIDIKSKNINEILSVLLI